MMVDHVCLRAAIATVLTLVASGSASAGGASESGGAPSPIEASVPLVVAGAAENAVERSASVSSARRSLASARAENPGLAWLEDLSLGIGASTSGDFDNLDATSFSGSASLSIPFLPQLSVQAGVNIDDNNNSEPRGSASVSFRPLVAATPILDFHRELDKSRLSLESADDSAASQGRAVLFGAAKAQIGRDSAQASLDLAQVELDRAEALYEAGFIARDELDSRRNARRDADRSLAQAEIDLVFAVDELQFVTGLDSVNAVPLAELAPVYREEIDALLADGGATGSEPPSLRSLRVDADYLRDKISRTLAISPSLSISASVSYPSATFGASINLSASPGDFVNDAREPYQNQLDSTVEQIAEAERTARYNSERAVLNLEFALSRWVDAQATVEEAEQRVRQDRLLLDQGSILQVTLVRSEASLRIAELQAYTRALDLLEDYLDLLVD